MFDRILIANRGEIAERIMKTCRRMGIGTLAVHSEADARSLHRTRADASVCLGGPAPLDSYLAQEKIIEAALSSGCQAIHPGYGFLSENASFAGRTQEAGLVFVGPPAPVIATLGDKIASKRLAVEAGLPVVPGPLHLLDGLEDVLLHAGRTGYPVMLKPSMGGGGKGMRIVAGPEEMARALAGCRAEARMAFGDERVFLESYLPGSRHVEVQIVADHHGNVLHLGERECSVQRRHQKIIEEAPSPAVDASLRAKLGKMACDLALRAGYTNAGTVEFLLDPRGNIYFLEVNTRLQVEHPVTEMVTELDLVELQIRTSCGEPLPIRQEDVSLKGWAMEARVCAEDPDRGFLPSSGMITRYHEPRGPGVRVDSGIETGSLVGIHYDSMLAKVIARGKDREEARTVLTDALNDYHIEGPVTNLVFLNAIVNHAAFAEGELSTTFLEEHFQEGRSKSSPPLESLHRMALAATLVYHNRQHLVRESMKPMTAKVGGEPAFRGSHAYVVQWEGGAFEIGLHQAEPGSPSWTGRVDGASYAVRTPRFEFYRRRLKLEIQGTLRRFLLQYRGNFIGVCHCGLDISFEIYNPLEWKLRCHVQSPPARQPEDALRCPMPGLVVAVLAKEGERVYKGQELAVIESMKMQSGVPSPCDAHVSRVMVRKGQTVEAGDILLVFKR